MSSKLVSVQYRSQKLLSEINELRKHDLQQISYIDTYFRKFNIKDPLHVSFTQKQRLGNDTIDDIKSSQNFKHFLNILNRKIYKKGYQRYNKRIQSFVVREYDETHRHHLHTILEIPSHLTVSEFKDLITTSWYQTRFGHKHIHFHQPTNEREKVGWVYYILKIRTKLDYYDCIDWDNCNPRTTN